MSSLHHSSEATHPVIIGITGGIGSGKSVVSRVLRLNGLMVYDCDSEAKILMENDTQLKAGLRNVLGPETYLNNGHLNKPLISSKIFSDKETRQKVNALVHEAVRKHFLIKASQCHGKVAFCESAILASSHFDQLCSKIWLIEAPEKVRVERVKFRDNHTEEEIMLRIASQQKEFDVFPEDKLIRICNDGTSPLLPHILQLITPFLPHKNICITHNLKI